MKADTEIESPSPDSPVETDDQLDLRARVTLARDSPTDAQQRQVIARVDSGPSSTLMFGDRVTIDVAPGSHVLHANNTLFWKRVPFAIEPGEHLEFRLVNRAGRLSLSLLALLGVAPLYLEIEQISIR